MAAKDNKELELELLREKLNHLETKVQKARDPEELFQERVAKYEAKQEEREQLKNQIEKRRMEIMMMPELAGKARMDEVILLESWERRAKNCEAKDPAFASRLRREYRRKIKEIQEDTMR